MTFDRKRLKLKPLAERVHDLDLGKLSPLDKTSRKADRRWVDIAGKIINAKAKGAAVILMAGGHVFRSGIQRHLIDLMERGYVSCLATQGAGMIHDYELALIGATTESVANYVDEGQFGLWQETGRLNDIIGESYLRDKAAGMGLAVGRAIQEGPYPHKEISLFAAAYRLNIPATVHVGVGYDIIHEHPNCDGAALGALSYNDFLRFVGVVERLSGGVVMNFGTAVMGPEIFLKALSMARNVAHQDGRRITAFSTVVCDLHDLPSDLSREPTKDHPDYYFRPWKTLLVRTLADGGASIYIQGRHAETIPELWCALNERE